jgi:hypothetical protein
MPRAVQYRAVRERGEGDGTLGRPVGPVVVSVVVVVACIAVGSWLAVGGGSEEPATRSAPVVRAPAPRARRTRPSPPVRPSPVVVGAEPALPVPWWVRLRSAVLLGCLSTALGVAAAVGVGLALVLLFGLLRASVG